MGVDRLGHKIGELHAPVTSRKWRHIVIVATAVRELDLVADPDLKLLGSKGVVDRPHPHLDPGELHGGPGRGRRDEITGIRGASRANCCQQQTQAEPP